MKGGLPMYNYGEEYYSAYFRHMKALHPSLKRMDRNMSGVCHHMMFEKEHIQGLFQLVERAHAGAPFCEIFLRNVKDVGGSGASEYEIYFNYMLQYKKTKMVIRRLKWANMQNISALGANGYDYVSCHSHMRQATADGSRDAP